MGNKADLYFVTRPREKKSIFLEPLTEGKTPITYWVLQAVIKPCWMKHTHHVLRPMRPREGGTYCFGCIRLRGVKSIFCGAIGLLEMNRVAVLGRGVLVEIKPIFCDCETKPQFGAEGKETHLCWVVR